MTRREKERRLFDLFLAVGNKLGWRARKISHFTCNIPRLIDGGYFDHIEGLLQRALAR